MAILQHPLEARFVEALQRIPPPGGNGCHQALLGAANYGAMAGYGEDAIVERLIANVPAGERPVPERELRDAVRKALRDHAVRLTGGLPTRIRQPSADQPIFDARRFMLDHLKAGAEATDGDVRNLSPIKIPDDPSRHGFQLVETLYGDKPDEYLFLGDPMDTAIQSVTDVLAKLQAEPPAKPHIIPNTFTGLRGPTKDGCGQSFRADSTIKSFVCCVAEFDTLPAYLLAEDLADCLPQHRDLDVVPFPRAWQLAFWATVKLPIVALIDSGGKSIHAWLKVDNCPDNSSWEQAIEKRLYSDFLIPLGVDSACRNESRLSRIPGFPPFMKRNWQRLLYLCPEGRPVCESST